MSLLETRRRVSARLLVDHDLARALIVAAAIVLVLFVLTLLVGVQVAAPSFELTPDPAGALPF